MPFSRHFLPEHNLVLTRVFGTISDDDVVENIQALNELHMAKEGLLELGDTRLLSPRDLASLTMGGILRASRLERGQSRVKGGKLAILAHNTLVYGFARAYTTMTSEHRADADAFKDLDEAIEWLGLGAHAREVEAFVVEARRKDEAAFASGAFRQA